MAWWEEYQELEIILNQNPTLRREFEVEGADLGRTFDVESALRLADRCLELGLEESASRFMDLFSRSVEFWTTTVFDITGKEIYFDVDVGRWRDADTGKFVADPYEWIRKSESDFESALREKYR